MDEDEHDRIAAGLVAGDAAAWQRLYDAYFDRVWRIVAARLGAADAADVVQEVFLAAAASAGRYDPARGTLWAWLWGIVRNEVASHCRRRGRLRETVLDDRCHDEPSPPMVVQSREDAERVRRILARLPEEQDDLLTLHYLDGTPTDELAALHGCSEQAIRSRLMRARAAFRELWRQRPQPTGRIVR